MKETIQDKQFSKFTRALRSDNPAKALLNLSEELYFLDQNREFLLEQFDLFSTHITNDEDIELIYETMDIIDGWCSPRRDAFLTQQDKDDNSLKESQFLQDLSTDDFLIALGKIQNSIPKIQKQLLTYHYHHHSVTRDALARSVGVSTPYVNIAYGNFGHRLSKELHFPPVIARKADGKPIWRSIFAKKQDNELVLKDNFGQAIKLLAWV